MIVIKSAKIISNHPEHILLTSNPLKIRKIKPLNRGFIFLCILRQVKEFYGIITSEK